MLGIARNDARYSTGWCVGPLRPMPMESWLNTNGTGRFIIAARPQRRPHVVGKDQVGDADGHDPAMGRHAVLHRAHGMLADAVMDIATAVVRRREWREPALVLVAPSRSGAPEISSGYGLGQHVDDVAGQLDAGFGLLLPRGAFAERPAAAPPSHPAGAPPRAVRGGGASREAEHRPGSATPRSPAGSADRPRARPIGCRPGPRSGHAASQGTVGPRRPFLEDAGAMCRARPFDLGQPRPMTVVQQIIDGRGSVFASRIAADTASTSWPSTSCTCHPLRRKRAGMSSLSANVDGAVVGHPVVVPEEDELAEPQVPGERYDLLPNALLQAAVPDEGIGVMIDDIGSQPLAQEGLGERHARRVGDALAERAGGDLDPAGRIELGMALAVGSEFAEALDLVDGDLLVAAQVKEGIEQHRSVPARLHEPVPVKPQRILRVELEVTREQGGHRIRRAQRGSGMPLAYPLDGVDREEADRIRHGARIDQGHDGIPFRSGSCGGHFDTGDDQPGISDVFCVEVPSVPPDGPSPVLARPKGPSAGTRILSRDSHQALPEATRQRSSGDGVAGHGGEKRDCARTYRTGTDVVLQRHDQPARCELPLRKARGFQRDTQPWAAMAMARKLRSNRLPFGGGAAGRWRRTSPSTGSACCRSGSARG